MDTDDSYPAVRQLRREINRAYVDATAIRLLHPHWRFLRRVETLLHRARLIVDDFLPPEPEPEPEGDDDS